MRLSGNRRAKTYFLLNLSAVKLYHYQELAKLANDLPFADELEALRRKVAQAA